jgi:hypothetical protein
MSPRPRRAKPSSTIGRKANAVIEEYLPRGLRLTVWQLLYQFVARAFIENT